MKWRSRCKRAGSRNPVGARPRCGRHLLRDSGLKHLLDVRVNRPEAIAEAAANRQPASSLLGEHGRLMIIAADHPARGALRAGDRKLAMADRTGLLDRLCLALSRPGVNGVLATPDILEDLLLLGPLAGKVLVPSINPAAPPPPPFH